MFIYLWENKNSRLNAALTARRRRGKTARWSGLITKLNARLITNGVPPGGHKCERDRNKIVWSSFLETGVTERNKKSTVAKVSRLRLPLRFSWIFRRVVVQKTFSKLLRWSVGIEPTLKGRLSTLSLSPLHCHETYVVASVAVILIVLSLA